MVLNFGPRKFWNTKSGSFRKNVGRPCFKTSIFLSACTIHDAASINSKRWHETIYVQLQFVRDWAVITAVDLCIFFRFRLWNGQ